jgi:RbsD / FucU transport protein family
MFAASKRFVIAVVCLVPIFATAQSRDWHAQVTQELPLMGHRNWIAIVDSAYPLQTSAGIETLETDADQLEVVKTVLDDIGKVRHVRPVIFTDAELKAVPESDAAGVTAYREALSKLLGRIEGGKVELQSLPHEEIISKLDEAGKTFHILVLKSNLTIPYTSVFIRLDCGYWTAEQEMRLRERVKVSRNR